MTTVDVPLGRIVVFTDVMCGWSTIALHHLYRARAEVGLEDRVTVDPQLFQLEDVNRMALSSRTIEGEKPVVGQLAEELACSSPGSGTPFEYLVTSMLHEVVEVADGCPAVDAGALAVALEDGRARGRMMRSYRAHREDLQGSPHFFFAAGYDVHNPGVEMQRAGRPPLPLAAAH